MRAVGWIEVNPDWTERSEPGEIVAVLDALKLAPGSSAPHSRDRTTPILPVA
jgi:hypothetical protein